MGLEREGALADYPWRPFESIVTALRPDIGPTYALGGHCGLTRSNCCQSSGPAEVILARGMYFPEFFFLSSLQYSSVGFLP